MQNHKKYSEMFEDIERQFFKDDEPNQVSFSFAVNTPVEMQNVLNRQSFEPPTEIPKNRATKIVEDLYQKAIKKQNDKLAAKVGQKRPLQLTQSSPFRLETEKRARFSENQTPTKEYVPLVKQVQDSFSLRPDAPQKDIQLQSMINPCQK